MARSISKTILLVEDSDEKRREYERYIGDLSKKRKCRISTKTAESFREVEKLVIKAKNGKDEDVIHCAVVDAQIWPDENKGTQDARVNIHWGREAIKKLEEMLLPQQLMIITSYAPSVKALLDTDVLRDRVFSKPLHKDLFKDFVEEMLFPESAEY